MKPYIGQIVLYRCNDYDAAMIIQIGNKDGRIGEKAKAGQQFPAIITNVFGHETIGFNVCMQVFVDGNFSYFKKGVEEGVLPHQWESLINAIR